MIPALIAKKPDDHIRKVRRLQPPMGEPEMLNQMIMLVKHFSKLSDNQRICRFRAATLSNNIFSTKQIKPVLHLISRVNHIKLRKLWGISGTWKKRSYPVVSTSTHLEYIRITTGINRSINISTH
jgi:hypothetical protein